MNLSVIISTYKSPAWLEKTLWGFQYQENKDFEVVIADDGSGEDTKKLIESFQGKFSYPISHVWHEDDGFRKTIILNKAITASRSDYLLFTDGDCIPRSDFVSKHLQYREKGYFLSGGYYKLPLAISTEITQHNISNQDAFSLRWLWDRGLKKTLKNFKLVATSWNKEGFFNTMTTTKASWNGHNSSGWKKDILAVNGFDERMEYGAEDREMGDRLFNIGIKSKRIRYSAICVHLDHPRGYVNQAALDKNRKIWNETKSKKIKRTDFGIINSLNP